MFTIKSAKIAMEKKELSSKELLDLVFKNIEEKNSMYNAYITITKEYAYKQLESNSKNQKNNFLFNIPISVKDMICTANIKTSAGSKMLDNFVPQYNATVVNKLEEAGYILVGKNNMDEFAMGSSNETSYYKAVKNPYDINRIPGGSSGGSAVSVALGMCLGSIGTDTGGSIRQPASLCGVVGIKPTYGRVSRYGVIAMASSLDQVGCFANTVEDTAIILQQIAGYDRLDSTSMKIEVPNYLKEIEDTYKKGIKGIKIGIPKEYFIDGIDSNILNKINEAISVFKSLGAEIIDISLPHTKYALSVYYIVMTAEVSTNLSKFVGTRFGYTPKEFNDFEDLASKCREEGFGDEVKRRILLGTYVLSQGYADKYYHTAKKVQRLIKIDFDEAFKKCDVILTPVSPTLAWKIGEKINDPLKMYLSDIFTIPTNLAGIPGISIPCGMVSSPDDNTLLPVGFQLLGKPFDEKTLFNVGAMYEKGINKV